MIAVSINERCAGYYLYSRTIIYKLRKRVKLYQRQVVNESIDRGCD